MGERSAPAFPLTLTPDYTTTDNGHCCHFVGNWHSSVVYHSTFCYPVFLPWRLSSYIGYPDCFPRGLLSYQGSFGTALCPGGLLSREREGAYVWHPKPKPHSDMSYFRFSLLINLKFKSVRFQRGQTVCAEVGWKLNAAVHQRPGLGVQRYSRLQRSGDVTGVILLLCIIHFLL